MASVEKVNLSGTNQIHFMAQPENSSQVKESSVRKYFTAPNIILGSLATVGVLGMADILICKGKHLNKITGKGKELEEALSRAGNAENRATAFESEASKIKQQLNDLIARLKRTTQLEGDLKITGEGKDINLIDNSGEEVFRVNDMMNAPLHKIRRGIPTLQKLQDLFWDIGDSTAISAEEKTRLLNRIRRHIKKIGYDLLEKYTPENAESFIPTSNQALKAPVVTNPAFIDKNGKTIVRGDVVLPSPVNIYN